jgi:predicted SAM-dependent methyltransferase
MRKIQFGCGSNLLDGWDNRDSDCDIRKPLPYRDGCADFIFAEHVIEHLTPQQAWNFLEECHRILVHGGVVRIAVPDAQRILLHSKPDYWAAVKKDGYGDGSPKDAVKAVVFAHGHQSVWTSNLLRTFLKAIGFKAELCSFGVSLHRELDNIEGHGKVVGDAIARQETSVVEGVRL